MRELLIFTGLGLEIDENSRSIMKESNEIACYPSWVLIDSKIDTEQIILN